MALTQNSYRDITVRFPAQIVIGKNSLLKLNDEIAQSGYTNVIIVTIAPLLPKIEPLINSLNAAGVSVTVNTSIVREPTYADFEALLHSVNGIYDDAVIGIGGGSVLDVAKVLAAQMDNTQSLNEIAGIGNLKKRSRKIICVPTTAGTGSEVSPNAILVDDADNQKNDSADFF